MEEKNGKSKLEELPPTENEFWQYAEKIQTENKIMNENCEHYLIIVSGNSAQCKHCLWGIFLGEGDDIRDGHLYSFDKKII